MTDPMDLPVPAASGPFPRAVADPREAFSDLMLGERPLGHVLSRVADLARTCTGGAREVSVTLLEATGARTAASTGEVATVLDEQQYKTDLGPCMDAARSGQVVRLDDTFRDATHPRLAAAAARRGVRTVVSIGLPGPRRGAGGINVYGCDTEVLDDDAVVLLQTFAAYAAVALANTALFTTAGLAGRLQGVVQSRAVIHQAVGVFAFQSHHTPEVAFQHLAQRARDTDRNLHDLAADVVRRAAGARAGTGVRDAGGGTGRRVGYRCPHLRDCCAPARACRLEVRQRPPAVSVPTTCRAGHTAGGAEDLGSRARADGSAMTEPIDHSSPRDQHAPSDRAARPGSPKPQRFTAPRPTNGTSRNGHSQDGHSADGASRDNASQDGAQDGGAVMDPRDAFAELGHLVLGEQPVSQVLQRVAELAHASVPGADQVSVTLLEGDSPKGRTSAFTGSLAATLDERQYDAGFGPCIDAAQSGRTIRVDDTTTEATYPDFAAIARRQGVRNVVSIGMPMPQRVLGGINVYRFGDEPLDEHAVELLQTFASYAAVALANASLFASTAALAGQLQTAMQSRAVIDQAQGVLVAQLHCTPEEAFQHLAKLSQHTNRKLRDLAAEIVQHAARG